MATALPQDLRNQANGLGQYRPQTELESILDAVRDSTTGAGNSVGLTGVVYDGSNRVTAYTLDGVSYTLAGWGTAAVTITGDNGSVRVVSFDGSGRISEVA